MGIALIKTLEGAMGGAALGAMGGLPGIADSVRIQNRLLEGAIVGTAMGAVVGSSMTVDQMIFADSQKTVDSVDDKKLN